MPDVFLLVYEVANLRPDRLRSVVIFQRIVFNRVLLIEFIREDDVDVFVPVVYAP